MRMIPTPVVVRMLEALKREYPKWNAPIVTYIKETRGTPYKILIATLLSLRTKDDTTRRAVNRLFEKAPGPDAMLALSEAEIRELIYPVGFYKVKAGRILEVTRILKEKYGSNVPDTIEELLLLPGVGRKTANLVVTLGYGKPGICVDTHVHRISNRWGYVKTSAPDKTEFALREKLPPEWWIEYNDILVAFGQTICQPVSPRCSECPVRSDCRRLGVVRSR